MPGMGVVNISMSQVQGNLSFPDLADSNTRYGTKLAVAVTAAYVY